MANQKISQLTLVVTPAGSDEYVINQAGISKKETRTQLLTYINTNLNPNTIPFTSGAGLSATDVGSAIDEVQGNVDALDSVDVTFSSTTGGILAANVHDALVELQDEILNLTATDISFSSTTGGILATNVHDALVEIQDEISGPTPLPSYTVLTLPDVVAYARVMIYVSDETGGPVPAFSDGTNWRRVTDRNIVS